MYVELRDVQSTIQQIVMAISAVLKIEVEVADADLFRIAGTGLIKQKIWQEMSGEDAVYRQCVESGQTIIIDRPGFNEICALCPHVGNCAEYGEICTPIKINEQVIGVIGLIAFSPEQREKLFGDQDANVYFLKKMSDVIATKVNENIIFRQQLIAEKKISTLVNCIDMGLLMLNKGACEFISGTARKMLQLRDEEEPSQELISQFSGHQKIGTNGAILWINLGSYRKKFFISVHQIDVQEKDEAEVILIEDPEHITQMATHITIDKQNQTSGLIGSSPAIQNIKHVLSKIKDETIPILFNGEDGTGKTFAAHFVHVSANKPDELFRKVNASYYSESDLNHLLFGDQANASQPGYLEKLDGGTLVLDEIDRIGQSTQLLLTKFLSDKLIDREDQPFKVNVRLISATNKNLMELVRSGRFRQDLYYKIGVVPLYMPPLRQRKDDIMMLADYFLSLLNLKTESFRKTFAREIQNVVASYDWPGNIQELSNAVEYAFNVSDEPVIRVDHFPDYLLEKYRHRAKQSNEIFNLHVIERETIKKALIKMKNEGKKKEDAATLLGIGRATLFRKISEYQLNA
ncbi:sigma 54-interacting transcriptional regulator [Sporolactobacillus sp. STCC-11]|uniref:sigma 54-interacting transcriptional regulator n=1 Tax=Sporolactobacillus caesalpiniae TaxID=3230362 RepID=UPI003396BE90